VSVALGGRQPSDPHEAGNGRQDRGGPKIIARPRVSAPEPPGWLRIPGV